VDELKANIFLSNRLEKLSDFLKGEIFKKRRSPFAFQYIVVPSGAMKFYLMKSCAKDPELQVIAGVQFLTLSQAVSRQIAVRGKRVPTFLELSLLLEAHLRLLIQGREHSSLCDYLDLPADIQKRRIGELAEQLSSLFLHHGIYGEETLEGWQAELWRTVFGKESSWTYPLRELKNEQRRGSMEPMHLFGFSSLPALYFHFFKRHGSSFYLLSPCQIFWTDLCREDHRLLANLGKLGRRFMILVEEEDLTTREEYVEEEGTLLQAVHNDLLNLSTSKKGEEDLSIQVHSAASKLREVEIVWDLIQGFLAQGIPPQEILILAPDINLYFPYITMVFNRSEGSLDYLVEDLEVGNYSHFFKHFLHLLSLPFKRFEREAVLQLLTSPYFLLRETLSSDEFSLIQKWMSRVKVFWGMDSDQREFFLGEKPLDRSEEGTWQRGMDRLLHALTTIDVDREDAFVIDFTQAELLGKLISLISSLNRDLTPLLKGGVEKFSVWVDRLKALAETYFSVEEEAKKLFKELDHLALLVDEECPFESVQRIFNHLLKQPTAHSHRGSHLQAIRFCSLKRGSALPAQVIHLMGMQESHYPRLALSPSFSLLKKEGERPPSQAEEDRYLFLELLLAARRFFVISYVRVDERDGKMEMPSSVVEELLSYLGRRRIFAHPDLPFDKVYFESGSPFYSYSQAHYVAAQAYYAPPQKRSSFFSDHQDASGERGELLIDIKHLNLLARNPIQFYFNRVLQIYLERDLSEEDEEFYPSYFQCAQLRRASLKKSKELIFQSAEQEGTLPQGAFKEIAVQKISQEIEELHGHLREFQLNPEELFSVELRAECKEPLWDERGLFFLPALRLSLGEGRSATLVGRIDHLSPQGLLVYGSALFKESLRFWPLFLIYLHLPDFAKKGEPLLLFAKSGERKKHVGESSGALALYIDYYTLCLKNISPFMPDWASSLLEGEAGDFEKAVASSLSFSSFPDPYVQWLSRRGLLMEARALFERWTPILREMHAEF
jgi:exodeoxyribonuclease V gamma subunit